MKNFCAFLRDHATSMINFERKKILPLTKTQLKSQQDAKVCHSCGKIFNKNFATDNNCHKVIGHCHYTGSYRGMTHSIYNLRFNVPNKIAVIFHNDSNFDYNFIIKALAKKFKRQFECLGY